MPSEERVAVILLSHRVVMVIPNELLNERVSPIVVMLWREPMRMLGKLLTHLEHPPAFLAMWTRNTTDDLVLPSTSLVCEARKSRHDQPPHRVPYKGEPHKPGRCL